MGSALIAHEPRERLNGVMTKHLFYRVAENENFVMKCVFEDGTKFELKLHNDDYVVTTGGFISTPFYEWAVVKLKLNVVVRKPEDTKTASNQEPEQTTLAQFTADQTYEHVSNAFTGALYALILLKFKLA